MSNAQYTPGTWTMENENQVWAGQRKICSCDFGGLGEWPEDRANAILIAALPNLLLLLKQAAARVELANTEGEMILSAWLPEALTAIAKAEAPQ